ncbi:MAG: hypothetical protein ABI843_00855 [Dokdonella sp.]
MSTKTSKPIPASRPSLAMFCIAPFALSCIAAQAGTVVGHCVSNAQQLQNALTASSTGGQYNGSDNRIKIVAGLYQTRLVTNPAPGAFTYENDSATGTLSVEGGYNSDCSARSSNPLATLLDGNFQFPVLVLGSKKAQIKVSGVTIENGESTQTGGGLVINLAAVDKSASIVFDTIIRNNHSATFGGGLFAGSDGAGNRTLVYNTLIINNSADQGDAAAELIGNGDGVSFYNNTIYGNSGPASGTDGAVYVSGDSCDIDNNIIYHNPNGGLLAACSAGSLYFNDVTILGGGETQQEGNVAVNPMFVDEDNGDFHLASGSPMLGFTPWLVNVGADLEGTPYPASGLQDIGCYEETLFADHFDFNNATR